MGAKELSGGMSCSKQSFNFCITSSSRCEVRSGSLVDGQRLVTTLSPKYGCGGSTFSTASEKMCVDKVNCHCKEFE